MRTLFLLFVISLSPVAKAELFGGFITWDCVCNQAGVWEAACPTAVGTYADGRRVPGINIRRCAALNGGETADVCTPGQIRNIYTSPAPAMTNLCRRPQQ